jgi:hypothetical protein
MLPSVLSAHAIENMTTSDPGEWLGQVASIAKRQWNPKIFIRWWILVNAGY